MYGKRYTIRIYMIFLCGIVLYYFLPAVKSIINWFEILVICLLFSLVYYLKSKDQFIIKLVLAALGIAVLFYLLGDANSLVEIISKFYYYFCAVIPSLLFSWFIQKKCNGEKKFIFYFISILLIYVLIKTLQELQINENATRTFSIANEMNEDNVGTYDFTYGIGALIPALGIYFSLVKKRYKKVLILLSNIILFYYLLYAQYTIAFLAAIIALISIPFFKRGNQRAKYIYIVFICVLLFFADRILFWLAAIVPSEQMSLRLYEVAMFFGNGDTTGYNLSGRMSLYTSAVQAFLQHPITGNVNLSFDSHSTILSTCAHLGIWGAALYIWMLVRLKSRTENSMGIIEKRDKWMYTPIFIYFLIMGLTNPVHSAFLTNAIVWFYAPLFINMAKEQLNKQRGEKYV